MNPTNNLTPSHPQAWAQLHNAAEPIVDDLVDIWARLDAIDPEHADALRHLIERLGARIEDLVVELIEANNHFYDTGDL